MTAHQPTSSASRPLPPQSAPADAVGDEPRATLVEELDALDPHLDDWDALAVAGEMPLCAPGWMLSWWRGAQPAGARLQVVLVHEGEELLALAPFFANPTFGLVELRLLGAGFSHRIGVLARAGAERLAAPSLASALAAVSPASVVFEGIDANDPWPDLVATHWPSRVRPARRTDGALQAPMIDLDGDYEAWLSRRGRRFRKEARRHERRVQEEGVNRRIACDQQAIDALLVLHRARWASRGGSNIGEDARSVLLGAAAALPPQRLLVSLLEGPDGPVSAELLLRAGKAAVFWGGGFDPAWNQYGPGMQAMMSALQLLAADGVNSADLGGGDHPYKRRLADQDTTLVWRTVFPRGWRYPLIRLQLAPKHLRLALRGCARRLPDSWQRRLKTLRRSVGSARNR